MTDVRGMVPHAPPAETVDSVEAVILVGGYGSRLLPLTLDTPKPMLPVGGVPLLTHLLRRVACSGVKRVVLATSYRSEAFFEYFGDGSDVGLTLEYVTEPVPLDTGGSVRNVVDRLESRDVLVLNGDVLSAGSLGDLVTLHRERAADVTLQLTRVADPQRFGSVRTDSADRVLSYTEKSSRPATDQVNAGCYVIRRDLLGRIPAGRPVSVDRETFPQLIAAGGTLIGRVESGYWLDVGTPRSFVRGCADMVLGTAPGLDSHGVSLVLPGGEVSSRAVLTGGTTVGAGCSVADGARLDATTLFDGSRVDEGASLVRCVVGRDAVVGAGAVLEDTVLADGVVIGPRNELIGARVWPGTRLDAGSIRSDLDRRAS